MTRRAMLMWLHVLATAAAVGALVACSAAPRHSVQRDTVSAATSEEPTAKALARGECDVPGLAVEVLEVKRTGAVLSVQLRMVNASAQALALADRFAADPSDRDTLGDAVLIEGAGERKYFVLRDRENRPSGSGVVPALEPGERRILVLNFPAPPAGTSRITILLPHVAPMRDVPIS